MAKPAPTPAPTPPPPPPPPLGLVASSRYFWPSVALAIVLLAGGSTWFGKTFLGTSNQSATATDNDESKKIFAELDGISKDLKGVKGLAAQKNLDSIGTVLIRVSSDLGNISSRLSSLETKLTAVKNTADSVEEKARIDAIVATINQKVEIERSRQRAFIQSAIERHSRAMNDFESTRDEVSAGRNIMVETKERNGAEEVFEVWRKNHDKRIENVCRELERSLRLKERLQ